MTDTKELKVREKQTLAAPAEQTKPFSVKDCALVALATGRKARLLQELAAGGDDRNRSVFLVGDIKQSIYGFRGSDVSCFQRFGEDYPAARTISLARNYRSTRAIVDASAPAATAWTASTARVMPQILTRVLIRKPYGNSAASTPR